jgi:RND family efflux transporter MFP subunit
MTRATQKKAHLVLVLSVLMSLTPIMISCSRSIGADSSETTNEMPTVAVVRASRTDLSNSLVLTAEFAPFQDVDVMAKVAGYVRQIKVDIGARVHEGQELARLEIPEMRDDLDRAAAAINEATAELAAARDELQRAESAHDMEHLSYSRILDVAKREPGLVPQQDVDQAHSRDLVAEAQVSAAKSKIAASEEHIRVSQAEEARLKTLYQYSIITAPFTGVVTKRYANTGTLIQAGTASQTQAMPLVRLSQNNLLRLALPVPESAVPLVHIGEPVNVRVSALNRTFPGRVARFAEKVDQATRTMETEVDVPNPALVLVPGMYAEVDLVTEERKGVLVVPIEAIDGGEFARVFAVRPPGTIQIVPIHLGIESAQMAEVRSGDLKEGDQLVVGSRSGLKQGDRVQAKGISLAGGPISKP